MSKRTAGKKVLGTDPFSSPRAAAPMALLSLDSRARPPAIAKSTPDTLAHTENLPVQPTHPTDRHKPNKRQKPLQTSRSAKYDSPDLQGPAVTPTATTQAQSAPTEPQSPEEDALLTPTERPFAQFERALAQRLSGGVHLGREHIERIEALLQALESSHVEPNVRGLAARLRRAWQFLRMYGRSTQVDDFGLDVRFEEMVSPLFQFMYNKWWRVEATGLENVPASGRALLVANHSGMLPWDGGMIKYAVRTHHPAHREVRPLVEDFLYHFPFLGSLMARIGGVRACQENAQRLLERDELAVVFPEGVKGIAKLYKYRYQLQRFGRGGFVKLCLRTGAPLIPVSVVGAEEIHPIIARADCLARPLKLPVVPITPTFPLFGPLGLIPLPTKWFIHFGKPIDLRPYGQSALEDELLINRITSEVRTTIQEQIYDALKKRRTIFWG